jgi:hypothetical protein
MPDRAHCNVSITSGSLFRGKYSQGISTLETTSAVMFKDSADGSSNGAARYDYVFSIRMRPGGVFRRVLADHHANETAAARDSCSS